MNTMLVLLLAGATAVLAANPAPITSSFDPSLRFASSDLPLTDSQLAINSAGPYGVHVTYVDPSSVYVQWYTGVGKVAVAPITDPSLAASPNGSSVVKFGTTSGAYTTSASGSSTTFNQIYSLAKVASAANYTSPNIHTVQLTGLKPLTTYYYTVGDGSTFSKEYSFSTPQAIGSYPQRFTVFGDMGTTYNSSTTLDHMITNSNADASHGPLVVFTGDFVYADTYLANGTYTLDVPDSAGTGTPNLPSIPSSLTAVSQTYQPRWDAWSQFMEPLISKYPIQPTFGNHELEPQSNGNFLVGAPIRYTTPYNGSGSPLNTVYSYEVSGAHMIVLNNWLDYNSTTPQYKWLVSDLAKVNKTRTPWLIVAFHSPWYNTYATHFQENECFRQAGYEKLFLNNGVNIVLHGHVHAYERSNPVYNYTVNPCGPTYFTIGDAGNSEGTYAFFADSPGKCPAVPVNGTASNQPDLTGAGQGGQGVPKACNSFLNGGANGGYCPASQPLYSAYREPSFGHATLDLLNSTTALWQWHRNQDGVAVVSDMTYISNFPSSCSVQTA